MTTPQDEPTNNQQLELQRLRTFEHLITNQMAQRANYFNKLLDPRRNLNKECGYPETQSITPDDYRNLYDRESIATRVVQVEPKETWQITPEVYEDEDNDTQTPFEVAWDELSKTLRGQSWYCDEKASPIWEHLLRADILSGIGHFGVLLLGIDDGQQLQFPIEGTPLDGYATDITGVQGANGGAAKPLDTAYGSPVATQPVGQGQLSSVLGTDAQYFNSYNPGQAPERKKGEALKLIFLRAFDESLVQIVQYESLITNPRFGQPIMYLITLNDPKEQHSGVGLPLATVRVHWSRVIHIADNLGSSEIFGVPRMRPVYNRLLDLAKLYGGSAEGYWRGAFPGLSIETHPQLGGDVSIDQTAMRDMMDNYYNKLDRGLSLTGMTAKSLAPMVVDPTPQIDGEIQAICIEKSVPKRVFMGSERGELASSEDADTWDDRLNGRRNGYVTPRIIVPFVDRLILIGVLPEPGGEVESDEEDTEDVIENAATIAKTGVAAEVVNEPESGIPSYSSGKDKAAKGKEKKSPGYHVKWPDMDEESPDSVAKNALARTQALAAYISGGCESVMDPLDYLVNELKYDEEVAKIIIEHSMKHLEDSYPDTEDEIMPGHVPAPPAPELPPNSPIKMGQGETLFDPNSGGVMHETKPAPVKTPVKNEDNDSQFLAEFSEPIDNAQWREVDGHPVMFAGASGGKVLSGGKHHAISGGGGSESVETPKPEKTGEVTFKASAPSKLGGKQYVAEITGASGSYDMSRTFVDKKLGKKRDESEHKVTSPGLFEEGDVTSVGKKQRHFAALHDEESGVLTKVPLQKEHAQHLANHLDEHNLEDIVSLKGKQVHFHKDTSMNFTTNELMTHGGPGSGPRPGGGSKSKLTKTYYSGSHEAFDSFNDHSYLTPDRDIAKEYGSHVNSATVDAEKVFEPESVKDIEEASGIPALEENRFVFEELDRRKVREALAEKGYHAVVFKDIAPNSPGDRTHEAVIVFDGSRITKQTTENREVADENFTLSNKWRKEFNDPNFLADLGIIDNGGPGSGPRPGGGTKKKMYRGVGAGADTSSGFEWFSETPELAGKYADFRGGQVEEREVTIENPIDVGNPNAVHDARSFFAQASKQADVSKLDKTEVLEARKSFLSHFGDEKREVIDYWSNPTAKEHTRKLLESMKFDSIKMMEGGEQTVALLRSKPTANEEVEYAFSL